MLKTQQSELYSRFIWSQSFSLTPRISKLSWVALWRWTEYSHHITATTRMMPATSVGFAADPHRPHWHTDPSSTCITPVRFGRIVFLQYYVQYLVGMLTNSVKDRTTNHTRIAYSMLHRACWWYGVQDQRDRGFSGAARGRLWQNVN